MIIDKYSPLKGNNIGDLYISECIRHCLGSNGHVVNVYDYYLRKTNSYAHSEAPLKPLQRILGYLQFNIPFLYACLKWGRSITSQEAARIKSIAVASPGGVLIGGGNILMDSHGLNYLKQAVIISKIYKEENIPCFVVSAGCGPFDHDSSKLLRELALNCDYISVRDKGSLAYFTDLGIEGVKLSYDPAFLVSELYPPIARNKNKLGVNVISTLDVKIPSLDWVNLLKQFLIENHLELVFIVSAFPQDLQYAENLSEYCRECGVDSEIRLLSLECDSLPEAYSDISCFIGCRMHSIIFALSYGIPSLGFSWSKKIDGMFEMIYGDRYAEHLVDHFYDVNNFKLIRDVIDDETIVPLDYIRAEIKGEIHQIVESADSIRLD